METVSFEQMTIKDVEELVGKKVIAVSQEGNWVVCTFGGGLAANGSLAADVDVKFRKW